MAKPGASVSKAKPKPVESKAKAKRSPVKTPTTAGRSKGVPPAPEALAPDNRLHRLSDAVQAVREGRRVSPRTARLLSAGVPKMAQKVVEEAAEVAIEAVQGRREALVNESVDLLYNLAVLWNAAGVRLEDLWAEMDRREGALGMAEKLPKADDV
jgi:phosphoribosyl-ATP pyrophosphohydrolase